MRLDFYVVLLKILQVNALIILKSNTSTIIGRKFFTVFRNREYGAFYNIRYAAPPLRFKPPILDGNNLDGYKDFSTPHINDNPNLEDCLKLSIFMPVTHDKRKFPVLVWIHQTPNILGPDFLIDEEIILVTVMHRTDILGFLNTDDEFSGGNMGAKDVLTALKWLQTNIYRFNGDEDKVTVMGIGSNAVIVSSMLLSTEADDLYERVIVFDGSALSPADYRTYNFEIANKLYWKIKGRIDKFDRKELYEILNNISVKQLLCLSRNLYDSTEIRDNQRLINTFSCTVEKPSHNTFMTKTPIEGYNRIMNNNNIEVLFGYTSLVSLYKLKELSNNKKLLKYLNYNFQYLLPFEGKHHEYESKQYKTIRHKIMDFYFLNGTISERSLRRYVKYISDQVIYPMLRQALLQREASIKNVYLCRFSFQGSLNVGWRDSVPNLKWMGATLGDQICYLFRCKSLNEIYTNLEAVSERQFIMKFVRLLANFVKYGNPTPIINDNLLGNLQWKPLERNKNLQGLNFGRRLKMIDVPEGKRFNFWDDLRNDFY